MGRLSTTLKRLLRLVLTVLLVLLGIGLIINPEPIPGTTRETTMIIGIVLVGIGGALYKIIGIEAKTRIQARTWKEEMKR